jgi:transposase
MLVVDRAGWHVGGELRLPAGSDLVYLPAAAPALQPAERLWSLLDEPIVNRAFPDLAALEAVLVDRSRTLEADPRRLQAHTRFHCWPAEPGTAS